MKDYHEFPSGLLIEWETDLQAEYLRDRDGVNSQEDLNNLQEKYRYIFPDIVGGC